ncbi:SIS domain-containing protein [Hahella sp. KA22]|uniref:MurR/RpiR family transcriptional regulator n=1 Tax=Hahella sp. KA22 TaxID=1628392 RepID=UPI000FDD213C|nr:MurR/RpiR family transcriptional regulator [Hahella sp. KA22]AZZ90593.1 MurR/RpiR family transcriptional regulator [Hahella sp. KA22]QAY53963.1 SIS domain-containing protein [Hahella sp. KA22]
MSTAIKPTNLLELQQAITERYNDLSKRLKQIAQFVMDHPSTVAMETVSVIAEQAEVTPSALIRFAAAFGYDGFSEMQQLFRQKLVENSTSYRERIRLSSAQPVHSGKVTSHAILNEFVNGNLLSLEHLPEMVSDESMDAAIKLLHNAKAIHVLGMRRSFSVASYLTYALRQIKRRVYLIDGSGGMLQEQASLLDKSDVLVAISYSPYAQETRAAVIKAYENGVPIISITDSRLSPLAPISSVYFDVKESEVRGFRSLTSSLCLAQALVIGMAYQIEQQQLGDG